MAQTFAATVKRGHAVGTRLAPHKHKDGTYVASRTRFERDYLRVDSLDALVEHWRAGYGIRMSTGPGGVPSLVSAASITHVAG